MECLDLSTSWRHTHKENLKIIFLYTHLINVSLTGFHPKSSHTLIRTFAITCRKLKIENYKSETISNSKWYQDNLKHFIKCSTKSKKKNNVSNIAASFIRWHIFFFIWTWVVQIRNTSYLPKYAWKMCLSSGLYVNSPSLE